MNSLNSLHLYEAILLLALRDKTGTFFSSTHYQFAIAGAILAELMLLKNVAMDGKYLHFSNRRMTGDLLLDECIDKIKTAKRHARIETWISRFANIKKLKHRVAEQLCQKGILQADEDKVLLIFTRKIYPELNPEPEHRIVNELYQAIFSDSEDIDPKTIILLSLAKQANLLTSTFNKKDLKTREGRMERIINGEITGQATKEAIQAMQAVVMVTCVLPAIMTSAVVTS
jgi:hypothetical protein